MRLSESVIKPPLSKWLALQVLLDPVEMEELLTLLGEVFLFQIDKLVPLDGGVLSIQEVLQAYTDYVNALKNGVYPDEKAFRNTFQGVITATEDAVYAFPTQDGRRMIKVAGPLILMQPHRMAYFADDGKFRSMIMTQESISWGVQFSYPQLFQDPETCIVEKVLHNPRFVNTEYFHKIQKWVRYNTQPTTFLVDNKKITTPMRLGKKVFPWINAHPGLKSKGFQVVTRSSNH